MPFTPVAIDYTGLFNNIPTALMMLDRNLCFVDANDAYLSLVQRTREELLGSYVFDAFPEEPEHMASARRAFEGALAGETTTMDQQIFAVRMPDGRLRNSIWNCTQAPVRGRDGAIIGLMQHPNDVSSLVAAERMRDIVTLEYDHRIRNILAKVTAIARRTARGAASVDAFVADFEGRVSAMTRTHQLLVQGGWERMPLYELINAELRPYAAHAERQLATRGPAVSLSSRVGQALGMALHELASNAARHGALAHPGGRLDVQWQFDDATGALHLEWHESGLSGLLPASRTGFGTTIIDQVLPSETEGLVDRRIAPEGLSCTIDIPNTGLA